MAYFQTIFLDSVLSSVSKYLTIVIYMQQNDMSSPKPSVYDNWEYKI